MAAGGQCVAAGEIERVAVRRGTRDKLGRDIADGANLVFDDDGPVELALQFVGNKTRNHIGSAAGREADDKTDILRWIGLCCDDMRCVNDQRSSERERTRGNALHQIPPVFLLLNDR